MHTDDISQNSSKTKDINLHGSGDFTGPVELSSDGDSAQRQPCSDVYAANMLLC